MRVYSIFGITKRERQFRKIRAFCGSMERAKEIAEHLFDEVTDIVAEK